MSGRVAPGALRLGRIAFINSLPVDAGILTKQIACAAELTAGTPAECNARLTGAELDLGPVSSLWYAQHQKELLLLPDLSISSESGVRSVLLFSRRPISELAGTPIRIKPYGRTTPALLEILCRERYGFIPLLEWMNEMMPGLPAGADACLLIGDEALVAKDSAAGGWHVTDLAEVWRTWTGLPVVFAVWAVRRDIYSRSAEAVHAVHESLMRSREWGAAHPDAVLELASRQIALPPPVLRDYFNALSFELGPRFREGLALYLKFARSAGLVGPIESFEMAGENPHLHSHL